MESDVKLQNGTVEITGQKVRADVGFSGGTVEINGSNLKTTVSDIEMLYYGGRLRAKGGEVELGSGDSGTFKGFSLLKDGTAKVNGDKLKASAGSAEIGSRSGGKFRGLILSDSGVGCYAYSLMVLNPDVQSNDGKQRTALSQSADDELSINVNGNYKGGIKLNGPVNITGDLSVQTTLHMKAGSKLLLLTPDKIVQGPGGKKIRIPGEAVDLLETIQNMHSTIKQLQEKVAALEAR